MHHSLASSSCFHTANLSSTWNLPPKLGLQHPALTQCLRLKCDGWCVDCAALSWLCPPETGCWPFYLLLCPCWPLGQSGALPNVDSFPLSQLPPKSAGPAWFPFFSSLFCFFSLVLPSCVGVILLFWKSKVFCWHSVDVLWGHFLSFFLFFFLFFFFFFFFNVFVEEGELHVLFLCHPDLIFPICFSFRVPISLLSFPLPSLWTYSWTLNKMGMSCVGPLIHGSVFNSKYNSTTQFAFGWICCYGIIVLGGLQI